MLRMLSIFNSTFAVQFHCKSEGFYREWVGCCREIRRLRGKNAALCICTFPKVFGACLVFHRLLRSSLHTAKYPGLI